jgi:AraC-like DNA-binding protein
VFEDPAAGSESSAPPAASPPPREKYRTSGLTEEESLAIRDRLLAHMRDAAPYRNGELTLGEVADALGVSSHHLSQVLNQRIGRNFFDFVNGYRIEAAKAMLAEPGGDRTVLEIAYESGFSNKTSFHQAFRKFVGATPTAFRAQARGNGAPSPEEG